MNHVSFDEALTLLRALVTTPIGSSARTPPWRFAPPCALREISTFQAEQGCVLPDDYTRVVTEFANGTVAGGPFDLFSLGMTKREDGHGPQVSYRPATEGALRRLFEHGLAKGFATDEDIAAYVADNGVPPPMFDDDVYPGAMPIACRGDGEWVYLAVTGQHAGTVWECSDGWMNPAPTPWLRPVSYAEWLAGEVAQQRGLVDEFRRLARI